MMLEIVASFCHNGIPDDGRYEPVGGRNAREGKRMDYFKRFLRDESGAAEAASSAVMIAVASGLSAIWNGGVSGIWNSLINNPQILILVVFTLVFFLWVVFKA
jgi:Flp pilus assembly pilin Flp